MRTVEEIKAEKDRCLIERGEYAKLGNIEMEKALNVRYWALVWVLGEEWVLGDEE